MERCPSGAMPQLAEESQPPDTGARADCGVIGWAGALLAEVTKTRIRRGQYLVLKYAHCIT